MPAFRPCALIPTYDNPGTIRDVGGAVRTVLPDVVVVDDASGDANRREVEKLGEEGLAIVTRRAVNGGKGAAVRAGMLDATADVVVFTDADMATPPDQIPLLVEALASADVALGSRVQPDGSDMRTTQPPYRRFVGRVFHLLAAIWVTGPVRDTQCGFKGFTRQAAHDLFGRQRITSIVFDVEVIHLARRRGYRTAVVPIRWLDKRGSRMRTGMGLALRVAWDLFRIPLLHRSVRRAGGRSAPHPAPGPPPQPASRSAPDRARPDAVVAHEEHR